MFAQLALWSRSTRPLEAVAALFWLMLASRIPVVIFGHAADSLCGRDALASRATQENPNVRKLAIAFRSRSRRPRRLPPRLAASKWRTGDRGRQELVPNGAGPPYAAPSSRSTLAPVFAGQSGNARCGTRKGRGRIQMNLLRASRRTSSPIALADGLKENNSAAELDAVKHKPSRYRDHESFGEAKEATSRDARLRRQRDRVAERRGQGIDPREAFTARSRNWLGDKPVQADLRRRSRRLTGSRDADFWRSCG